jgi:hypothetical protein
MPSTPFNSLPSSSIHHLRRDTPTIARAVTVLGRWVTRIAVCFGPSLRRHVLNTTGTSPR